MNDQGYTLEVNRPCKARHCVHPFQDSTPMKGVAFYYCCRKGCRDLHVVVGDDPGLEEKTHGGPIFSEGGPVVHRKLLKAAVENEGTAHAIAAIRADERVKHSAALLKLAEELVATDPRVAQGVLLAAGLVKDGKVEAKSR